MTVYADILFLVNFSMDLLTLIFVCRITHRRVKRVRLILAAAAGGLGGTVLSVLSFSGMAGTFFSLTVMTGMAWIAFGIRTGIVRNALMVCGGGTLLGGVMTALLSLGEPVMLDYGSMYPALFLACAGAVWLFSRLPGASSAKQSAEVSVTARGITKTFSALVDSGCFLTEPISGIPVITASRSILGELAQVLTQPEFGMNIRVIPVKTLTGDGILYGFVPDSVTVDGVEVRAAVAVDEERRGGYDGIVPAGLAGMKLTTLHTRRKI